MLIGFSTPCVDKEYGGVCHNNFGTFRTDSKNIQQRLTKNLPFGNPPGYCHDTELVG